MDYGKTANEYPEMTPMDIEQTMLGFAGEIEPSIPPKKQKAGTKIV